MKKIYAYIDESGQDTKGKLFLVSVIIIEKDREELRKKLENIETISNKGYRKWTHANKKRRETYINEIIKSGLFKNSIFYSSYENTKSYVDLTILTTAKAIIKKSKEPYKATILVDGLTKGERQYFATGLRKLDVKIRKVRGVDDENDAIIRLADAIAGFVRNYTEGSAEMTKLYKLATNKNIVIKI